MYVLRRLAMVRKTKEDALATRDLILDTAECVFQRRGVAATLACRRSRRPPA